MTVKTHVQYEPRANHEVKFSDVEYLKIDGISLLARVYRPQASGPFPMIIDIHGGGWTMFSRERDEAIALEMASHGLVWISVDVRLSDVAPWPALQQDFNFAIRYFKAHAAEYDVSAEHVGVFGPSSGGHTVMLAGLRPHYPDYNAIPLPEAPDVDASVDFVISSGTSPDVVALLARLTGPGAELGQKIEKYFGGVQGALSVSPQTIIESDEEISVPPILILQAGEDFGWGTTPEMNRFAQTYVEKRKGQIEIAYMANAPHIWINRGLVPESESMFRGLEILNHYIARQVYYLEHPFVAK